MEVSRATFVFFEIVERDLKSDLPCHIKNILNANGWNSAIIFKLFKTDNIDRLEQFVRIRLQSILEIDHTESSETIYPFFFGTYSKPEEFKFTEDEKALLLQIARHVKIIVDSIKDNSGLDHFQNEDGLKESLNNFTGSFYKPIINSAHTTPQENSHTHLFLNKLKNTADRNIFRTQAGYRYDDDIKDFAAYVRMLAGRMAYETIHRNLELSIPSVSTIDRYIRKKDNPLIEGELRCQQLLNYLVERRLPLIVSLSEDATRISGRPQYDSKTNQIVGFVLPCDHEGMPVPLSFPGRNAREMVHHFTYQETAHMVNVVMAKPLANAPGFCLLLYAANSKFTAESAMKRWKYISAELVKLGISVIAISSDSDPRYNSAMRKSSGLGSPHSPFEQEIDWFQCGISDENQISPFYIQDTVHLGTKLRNCFLKTKSKPRKLPFGANYYIQVQFLEEILERYTKDKHQLTVSTLDPTDRQNFGSVQRICDKKVINLLKNVKNSEATQIFLEIIAALIESFGAADILPLDRIERIWHALFIIRIWRQYIVSRKDTNLKENFLSQNCYTCIELNAHGLVLLTIHLKRNNMSEYFLPFLLNSQPCEAFFRQIRSFTSTYSTVANCSVKEIVGRINKIQMQRDISFRSDLKFPRAYNSKFAMKNTHNLPSEREIIERIEKCKVDACKIAVGIGLMEKRHIRKFDFSCRVQPISIKTGKKIKLPDPMSASLKMCIPKMLALKNFHTKFVKRVVPENSPFVEIECQQMERLIIKKTSFCWLLRTDYAKLSSDRLMRVQAVTRPLSLRGERCKLKAFKGVKIKKIEQKLKFRKYT